MTRELTSHTVEIKVNPALVRNNEIKRLSGDRTKLESVITAPRSRDFEETLAWMLEHQV